MDGKKREIRSVGCQLAVREAAPNEEGNARTITGTAILFDTPSVLLDEWGERFREIIAPEAVTQEWLDGQDVKLNLLHEREMTIARCNKGKGNMRLTVTERGVDFEFDAPKCDIGDRALELVRSGVYTGCSFEFYPDKYEVNEEGSEVIVTHKHFAAITALTIGMDPAYIQTSVNAREIVHGGHRQAEGEDEEQENRELDLAYERAKSAARMRMIARDMEECVY